MKKLSTKQEDILNFIREYRDEHGYPPSVRDIQEACGISSTSVVHYNLQILQREGFIKRAPEVSRGLDLLDERGVSTRGKAPTVPVLGPIAAGTPIPVPTEETFRQVAEDTVALPADLNIKDTRGLFALRVRGQSMIDALIDDGDVVVLRAANTASDGEMVAAWLKLEQEATLKKFYREGRNIRLQPANSTMKPIIVAASNVEVKGKVVAVIRHLV